MNKPIWAIVWPNGSRVLADSDFKDEKDAWNVALGWPDSEEIEAAKKQGYKAVRVTALVPFVDMLTDEEKARREQMLADLHSRGLIKRRQSGEQSVK